MDALAITLEPICRGWAVTLINDRELVRFIGPGAGRKRCDARAPALMRRGPLNGPEGLR